jgi:hypothetical protein
MEIAMQKLVSIATSLAVGASLLLASATVQAADTGKQRTPRGEMVHRIVMKWGVHVQQAYRADVHDWTRAMAPIFANSSLENLRRAANARSFEQMNDALLGPAAGGGATPKMRNVADRRFVAKQLGDDGIDQTYTPITPCRVIDTRNAGGVIPANGSRNFEFTGRANFAFQGGASSCPGLPLSGAVSAVALNVTVVFPNGDGFVTAYPFGQTRPLASTVNYTSNDIRGNLALVPLGRSLSSDFEVSIYSFAQTHIVADMVGYFAPPQATSFDCTAGDQDTVLIQPNSATTFSAECFQDPGLTYTVVGGGCDVASDNARIVKSYNTDLLHTCRVRNDSNTVIQATAIVRCCRVPGRTD